MFPQNLPADDLPKHGALAFSPTVLSAFCGAKLWPLWNVLESHVNSKAEKLFPPFLLLKEKVQNLKEPHPRQAHPHNRVYPETHSLKSRVIWRQIPWLFQCNWKFSEPIPYYSDKLVPPVVSKGTSSVGSTLLNLLGRDICRRQSWDYFFSPSPSSPSHLKDQIEVTHQYSGQISTRTLKNWTDMQSLSRTPT